MGGKAKQGGSRGFEGSNPREKVGEVYATVDEKAGIADQDLLAANASNYPLSRHRLERIHIRRRNTTIECRLEHGLRERMFGRRFGGSCYSQQFLFGRIRNFDLADNGPAFRQRSSFVHHDFL